MVYGVAPGLRPAIELGVPAPNSLAPFWTEYLNLHRSKSNVLSHVPTMIKFFTKNWTLLALVKFTKDIKH